MQQHDFVTQTFYLGIFNSLVSSRAQWRLWAAVGLLSRIVWKWFGWWNANDKFNLSSVQLIKNNNFSYRIDMLWNQVTSTSSCEVEHISKRILRMHTTHNREAHIYLPTTYIKQRPALVRFKNIPQIGCLFCLFTHDNLSLTRNCVRNDMEHQRFQHHIVMKSGCGMKSLIPWFHSCCKSFVC